MHRLVRGGISPFVIAAVRESHVADAERSVRPQHAEVAVDHVAAFDAKECCNLPLFVGIADFGRCRGKNEIVRMLANLLANSVDLNNGAVDRIRAGNLAGHPNGKENGSDIAFAHAGNVDAAGGAARSKIKLAVEKALRRVVMGVHDDA